MAKEITFTQTISIDKGDIRSFATFCGWEEMIQEAVKDENGNVSRYDLVDNPKSEIEFIKEKLKTHVEHFVLGWAKLAVNKRINETVRTQIEDEIIKPITDGVKVDHKEREIEAK